jgi:hypothetical protein
LTSYDTPGWLFSAAEFAVGAETEFAVAEVSAFNISRAEAQG